MKVSAWLHGNCRFAQATPLAVDPTALGNALAIQVRNVVQGLAGPEKASDPQVMEDTTTIMGKVTPSIQSAATTLATNINQALQELYNERSQTQTTNSTMATNESAIGDASVPTGSAPAAPIPGM